MENYHHSPSIIQPRKTHKSSLDSLSWVASITVILIASFVLVGWIFDIGLFKSVLPGLVTMKANTAIGFMLGGISLFLWHQQRQSLQWSPNALVCAIIVLLIGLLTLMQYGFDINLGIDQLFFKESVDAVATAKPGRMAPNSAFNFLLLGSALVLTCLPRPNYLPAQILTILAFLISLLGFLGYLYGNAVFYKFDSSFTAMAIHTAVAFILLCLGLLFATHNSGVMAVITSDNAGGIMAQRLFPAAIIFPPVLCWIILIGFRREVYSPEMGISLLGILIVIVFSIVIWWNALSMGIVDVRRSKAEDSLKKTFEELENKAQQQEQLATQLQTTFTEITAAMNELAASSQTTAEQAAAADKEAQIVLNISQDGTTTVTDSQRVMNHLEQKVTAIGSEILNTQQQADQIGEISRLVRNLATQTNMLALNAAIEAVRAGEHGQGFGVVASEIRKLADQSKTYADKINDLVAIIQQAIQTTVAVTTEGIETVNSNVTVAEKTTLAFENVVKAIEKIVINNKEISMTANQQAIAIRQVVNVVNEIQVNHSKTNSETTTILSHKS